MATRKVLVFIHAMIRHFWGLMENRLQEEYNERTPGKFKPGFEGDGMVCFYSKEVHGWRQHA